MLKDVSIGYASAREMLDSVVTPAYSQFLKIQSRENAIEVAQAVWNMTDRRWYDLNPGTDPRSDPNRYKAFKADLTIACPELALIQDIAESAKHGGQLERGSVKVRVITGAGSPGGTVYVFSPLGMNQFTPECQLVVECLDGTNRPLPDILALAVKYWHRALEVQISRNLEI
jgi:hypothetical protein